MMLFDGFKFSGSTPKRVKLVLGHLVQKLNLVKIIILDIYIYYSYKGKQRF